MNEARAQLLKSFHNQLHFSLEYSPLYASFFAAIAGVLPEEGHPLGDWLEKAAHGRRPLDVSLLLAAGLHRQILLGHADYASLAPYYPSVGGERPAGYAAEDGWQVDEAYKTALYHTISADREFLHGYIQESQVQTNETGRGLSWLYPVSAAGWSRLHLLELGASAGLNLLADKRSYHFVDDADRRTRFHLGEAAPVQFAVRSFGGAEYLGPDLSTPPPTILSRVGCDINPVALRDAADEAALTAYVWADQTARLARLREGIAAYQQARQGPVPVRLHAVELPHGLPHFLARHVSRDGQPVLCYNTFIKMYLPQKGALLREHIAAWARDLAAPVIWIQWEPPSCLRYVAGEPPEYGWLAWTIDLWHRGQAQHWHVAWIHPHGQKVIWLPALQDWIAEAGAFAL